MDDMPVNSASKRKNKKKAFYKKWWVWVILVVVIVLARFGFGFDFGYSFIDEMLHSYEELDVSGKSIVEACEIVKGQGWKVSGVEDGSSHSGKTDCYNTKYVASGAKYYNSNKSAIIYYTLPKVDETEFIGLAVSEACAKAKALEWNVDSIRQNIPNNYQEISTCSGDEIVESAKFSGTYVTFYVYTDDPLPKKESSSSSSSASDSGSSSNSSSSSSSNSSSSSSSSSTSTTNSSFRKVMDDYESFMNKYVDFMKKYKNSSDVASMLSDYSKMMQDYAKYAESIKGYNQSNLSASDWAYYLEVTARVTKKIAEI